MSLKRPAAGGESCKQDSFLYPISESCNYKNMLDKNTILVYYSTMTVIQKEGVMEYNSSLPDLYPGGKFYKKGYCYRQAVSGREAPICP